jgi:hypothetical protein
MNYFWIPMDNDNIVRDFWHISSDGSQHAELDDKVLAVGHSSQTPLQFQCLRTWKWKVKVIINKWKYILHLALKKIIFLNMFFYSSPGLVLNSDARMESEKVSVSFAWKLEWPKENESLRVLSCIDIRGKNKHTFKLRRMELGQSQ